MPSIPLDTRRKTISTSIPSAKISTGEAEVFKEVQNLGKTGQLLAAEVMKKRANAIDIKDSQDKEFQLSQEWIERDKQLILNRLPDGRMKREYGLKEDGLAYNYDEAVAKETEELIDRISETSVSDTSKRMFQTKANASRKSWYISAASTTHKAFNADIDKLRVDQQELAGRSFQFDGNLETYKASYGNSMLNIYEYGQGENSVHNAETVQDNVDKTRNYYATTGLDSMNTREDYPQMLAAMFSATLPERSTGKDGRILQVNASSSLISKEIKAIMDADKTLTEGERNLLNVKLHSTADSMGLQRDYKLSDMMSELTPAEVNKYTRIALKGLKTDILKKSRTFQKDVGAAEHIAKMGQGSSVPEFNKQVRALYDSASLFQEKEELKNTMIRLRSILDINRVASSVNNMHFSKRAGAINSTLNNFNRIEAEVERDIPELSKYKAGLSVWDNKLSIKEGLKRSAAINEKNYRIDPTNQAIKDNPNIANAKTLGERTKRLDEHFDKVGIKDWNKRYVSEAEAVGWNKEVNYLESDKIGRWYIDLRADFGSNAEALDREILSKKSTNKYLALTSMMKGENVSYVADLLRNPEGMKERKAKFTSGATGILNKFRLEGVMSSMGEFTKFKKAVVFEYNGREREAAEGKVKTLLSEAVMMEVNKGASFSQAEEIAQRKILSDNYNFVKNKDNYIMLSYRDPITESEVSTFVNEVNTGKDLLRLGAVPSEAIMRITDAKVGVDFLKPSERVKDAYNSLAKQAQFARARDGKGLAMYVYDEKEFRYVPLMSKEDRGKMLVIPWSTIRGNEKVIKGEEPSFLDKPW